MFVHNNSHDNISSIETCMTAVKVRQNPVDYWPYTGYGSHNFKCPPLRQTILVWRCRTYGSCGLRLIALLLSNRAKFGMVRHQYDTVRNCQRSTASNWHYNDRTSVVMSDRWEEQGQSRLVDVSQHRLSPWHNKGDMYGTNLKFCVLPFFISRQSTSK